MRAIQLTAEELAPDLRGNAPGITKIDKYRWSKLDSPGVFQMIPKGMLGVDHNYQRDRISSSRVAQIAAEFSYRKLGVLLVADRGEGGLWVFDGQHRKLAADKRADVRDLPCLVFESNGGGLRAEAQDFLGVNTTKTGVPVADKFKALLVSGDRSAVEIDEWVRLGGYKPGANTGNGVIACLGTIMQSHKLSPEHCRRALAICMEVAAGAQITNNFFGGAFYLERWLESHKAGSLRDEHNMKALKSAGVGRINEEITRAAAYFARGGAKVFAQGIVNILNHRRTTRRIMFSIETAE